VLAARLWLQAAPAWTQGYAWWHSERRLRAAQPVPARAGHLPDAEIHWPSLPASPYAGQVWAVEVELTPKPLARTTRIMAGLLSGPARYAQVLYLTAPPARPDNGKQPADRVIREATGDQKTGSGVQSGRHG
jgi:hypothetical protein